ncbi:MAG: CDP-alcohol phosphatidyltransferase family protein [Chloroflexi bacterium]|nr:MAG: CDP-alcohol phosphatidyltransferase family protein [Chloroflexota bacterium]TME98467.1 MAG: CDP-alcohol phosphatidyltransferase family protein [Chloroflexota bacterium]
MHATRAAIVASVVYVVAGLAWAWSGWQPGPPLLVTAWIVVVAAAGAFVPGIANQVTLARAYLAAPALVYAMAPGGFGPLAVTVAIAGLTDLVDGTIARRTRAVSSFGGGLDPVVDGIFIGAMGLGLTAAGAIPLWLALVAVARYVLPAAGGAVLVLRRKRVDFRHTVTGQISTTLNLVLIGGVALLRGLNLDPRNLVLGAEIVIPVATVATFVHLALALREWARTTGPA